MTTHKFKIGDRVKWRDDEGRELSGTVLVAADERGQITVREHRDELFVARWHESHLSLDVPEDASWRIKACELQALLSVGMPIFCGKVEALVKASDGQKKEIERLTRLNSDHLDDSLELSRRLTEEIGGRHRERFAREAAQKELAQTKENERWCCDKLSELANELSAERVAKTSAQNELADLRQDLADLRAISKRLAL